MKPVTGNITGYRLTGNRLTTLIKTSSRRHDKDLFKSLINAKVPVAVTFIDYSFFATASHSYGVISSHKPLAALIKMCWCVPENISF